MKYAIIIILTVFFIQNCNTISRKGIKIKKQELLYDSLNNNQGLFKLKLYTRLTFDKKMSPSEYKEYSVIIDNDTLKLSPELNLKDFIILDDEKSEIEFISKLNLTSKIYDNDSLTKIITEKSRVINSKGEIITKDKNYTFKSLITIIKTGGKEQKIF